MEFIEFIKSLFGSKTKTDDKLDDVKSQVADMQKKDPLPERQTLPDTPTYERVDYVAPTDEEIAAAAKAELEAYNRAGLAAVENQAGTERDKLEKQKAAQADSIESRKKAVDAAYDRADEQTANDVLKRGVARSSIAVNRMADLSQARANEQAAVEKSYADAVAAIDEQLGGLELKRQQALDAFNIASAAKLTERINALKADRADKQLAALKYNNSLTEKESEAARDKAAQESKLYSEQLAQLEKENQLEREYGTKTETRHRAAYDLMRAALADMSKSEARDAVRNDPFFEENLSQYWYYKLYDEFGR